MKIHIISFGRKLRPHEQTWIDDYLLRCRKLGCVEHTRLKDEESSKTWSKIESRIPKQSSLVVLDDQGRSMSTEKFRGYVQQVSRSAHPNLTFLIGGAYGLPPEALRAADLHLSLSAMTFPHRLALLLLCEQIYRVLSWEAGTPYHHA